MVGILVVVVLSGVVLWLFSKEHLTVLGIKPTRRRLEEFGIGFILMAIFCTINLMGQAFFKGQSYVQNPDFGISELTFSVYWAFKAALFEELIFRGVILYILIRTIGLLRACLVAGIAFGIYHWFSYEMFDRGLIPMLYVFLLTGASGWAFAYSFAKTKSLYAPLGLHFGWIVMSIAIFSAGPLGDSFLIIQGEDVELGGWEQLLFFLWQTIFVPGIITWYLAKRYKVSEA